MKILISNLIKIIKLITLTTTKFPPPPLPPQKWIDLNYNLNLYVNLNIYYMNNKKLKIFAFYYDH